MKLNLLSSSSLLALASSLVPQASAVITSDLSSLAKQSYDFIIVGAGNAGAVLAGRLSETKASVLLLEAGYENNDTYYELVPFFASKIQNTPYDWNFTITNQPGLDGRNLTYHRGRGIGGSTLLHYLVYTRGTKEDFDRFASVTGDNGWGWDNMLNYFKKAEKFEEPVDGRNISDEYDPSVHGYSGAIPVTPPGYLTPVEPLVKNASTQLPGYGWIDDLNAGVPLGISTMPSTIGPSQRYSSARGYLTVNVTERDNLNVGVGAWVTQVLFEGTKAVGVEVAAGLNGTRYKIMTNKEVILSAGAIQSPQILKLSGVGNKTELAQYGIQSVIDSPYVGANLQDHQMVPANWKVSSNDTNDALSNSTVLTYWAGVYNSTGGGRFVDTFGNSAAFVRVSSNLTSQSVWQQHGDTAPGPYSPHIELVFANGWGNPNVPNPDNGYYLGVAHNLLYPISRGTVTLQSSNPFDAPVIDMNYFSDPEGLDMKVVIDAIRQTRHILSAPAFDGYIISPDSTTINVNTDEEIAAYVRNYTTTVYHAVGTTAMGGDVDGRQGVVDGQLFVKGAQGLRVVDAGVIPYQTGSHTQAPLYAIAERAADLIKQKYWL